ncbi:MULTISPECIES: lantibiotic dehydratase [unclassified Streptomyces]|uniref:lantibiotic dehydratase n=1 Tax=unclassified Streptomyces TaxID=2593676 RepID=UPI0004C62D85|nr:MULTISPECIES: lantibiotic dehydratase [unclassified Streptomyces]KOV73328.1 lantibiotic dehydratase [Streptomyces sp. NRRL WC-3723]
MGHLPVQATDDSDGALGRTALLRLGGMPGVAWAAGGAPRLFESVVRHADAVERIAVRGRALADRLGAEVVPQASLAAADRGAVLALRRRLHSGAAPRTQDCLLLLRLPAVPADLAEQAHALLREAEAADAAPAGLRQAVVAEQRRVAEQAWRTACDSPVMRAFVDSAAPGLVDEIERRLAAGQSWSSRNLRKRAAYLWRLVGRAAAKTTPRGWTGQIAALPVAAGPVDCPPLLPPGTPSLPVGSDPAGCPSLPVSSASGGCPSLLAPGTSLGPLAAVAVENVHLVRARTTPPDLRTAAPETLLAPTPLHFAEAPPTGPGRVRCYVVDPLEPGRLRQIVLRRTRVLEGVLALLADGPRPLGELDRTLPASTAPPGGPPLSHGVLRGFLQHLHSLGVLQICQAPRHYRSAWVPADTVTTTGALPKAPTGGGSGAWFLDSYRCLGADAAVSGPAVARVERGLRIAARIAALREADNVPDGPEEGFSSAELTERPRPISEILADRLSADTPPPTPRRYTGWPPARDPAGGYARLLDHLDAAARSGADHVDLDDALLDALGAPRGGDALPRWPVDCLLRPLAPAAGGGPVAVLETASAAGVLDARFADGLRALYGGHRNSDAYRAFLAAVEQRTGVRFVDLLVPPLTERSANAVRRPVTTRWWTGDPDPTPYYGSPGRHARYLPLDRISLRRGSRGRIVAEADGRRIIPVHHATRSPAPPYDTLVRLLLAASHPAASCLVRLDALDAALPDRARLSRLTAGGDLVLAPATWRIDRARLWRPGDDPLAKVRALALLRRSAGLPRYAFARTAPGAKPVPVDLVSLTAFHLIERLCAQEAGTALWLEEMLPAPGDLLLRDPLHGGATVAAQLLLRLPHDQSAGRLAGAAADALVHGGPPDVPGPPARRPAGADPTR